MTDSILSVKTNSLIEKVWEIMTNSSSYFESMGTNVDEIIFIYNELCRCSKQIKTCDSEQEYSRIEDKVRMCEKQVNSYI